MNQQWLLLISAFGFLFLVVLLSRVTSSKENNYQYKFTPELLTKTELAFYLQLVQLLPEYHVMCKVRLADLLSPNESGKRWRYAFNKISSKHVDFVIIHPQTAQVVLAIELDDKSHDKLDRKNRDLFVNSISAQSGLPLYRHTVGTQLTRPQLEL